MFTEDESEITEEKIQEIKSNIVSISEVFAINLKTDKVLRFKTQSEAARQLGINLGSINAVLKGRQYMAGGYWFTEDKSEITEEKIKEVKAKIKLHSVIAINPETSEVFWFESQHEAARQLGVPVGMINKVVKGKQNKTHDYYFTNADENAVEKTRAKFGDEITSKVEKLMGEHLN